MPSADLPLVSVIIPAFNAEATIEETLLSALAQTYRAIEIIVVDDGSADSTARIVAALAARDPRLRLIGTANGGASRARNIAIAASSGLYVAPLDSDDLWHKEKIARQVAAMRDAAEPPGLVYCFFHRIDGASRPIAGEPPVACRGPVLHRLAYKAFVAASATLFSRSALIEAGGYDERLRHAEDHLLHLRVARRHPFELVEQSLVGYRLRPGSLSHEAQAALASLKLATRLFRAECGDVPAFVWRWAIGRRNLHLAASRAAQGRYLSGLYCLAAAIRRDPRRTLSYMVYRLRVAAHRGLGLGPAPAANGIAHLAPLEARRFARLAALDAARASRAWSA